MTKHVDSSQSTRLTPFCLTLILLCLLLGIPQLGYALAEKKPPVSANLLYPTYEITDKLTHLTGPEWFNIIRKLIPPLKNQPGERWPLVLIDGVGFKPLSEEHIRILQERGIAQHLDLHEHSIPAAKALQKAGSPVILTAGGSGAWPYTLAADKKQWAHHYPDYLKIAPHWRDLPSPTMFRGWAVAGQQLRTLLERFQKENIVVDALWLDYENEPSQADYYAAILSPTTRALLPKKAIASETAFRLYCRQLWVQLLSTYFAGPAREVFPNISVTNWVATLSSPEIPVLGWENRPHPPMGPTLFTATNPIAYGVDTTFIALWDTKFRLDQEHVDQFYMHILLRQVSADSENRQHLAPYLDSFPWVARWVPDNPQTKVPVMSRDRYREALRHLWLRGINGMQVFNPELLSQVSKVEMAIAEVQDAVAIYDEMLAYRDFLDNGTVMQFHYPAIQDQGPIWSGLRLRNNAIVRVFWQGPRIGQLKIEPWPDTFITLNNPTRGATFHLRLDHKTNKIKIVAVSR